MNQIHGHEVMQMMLQSGKAYTRASLLADIVATFGPGARFFTCSAENMSLPALLDFLAERDKVQLRDNLVLPGSSPACAHD